jgi:hypothetical protein
MVRPKRKAGAARKGTGRTSTREAATARGAGDAGDAPTETKASGGAGAVPLKLATGILQVNEVRIDDAQLAREADQVAQEAAADDAAAAAALPPTPEAEAAAAQVENAEEGYKILALAVVGQGYELFAPAWHVTPLEKGDMADALVAALMLWFPDGLIPAKYMALLVIAGIGAKIAIARRDPVTGILAPRHDPAPEATTATAH